jgi:hypothetical protein
MLFPLLIGASLLASANTASWYAASHINYTTVTGLVLAFRSTFLS